MSVADSPTPRRSPSPPSVMRVKRRAFLARLAVEGNVLRACRAVGIDPAQPYRWAHQSDAFAEKMRVAQARGEQQLLVDYEAHLDERATAGPGDRMSAILLMFRVKRLDPRYRDNAQVALNVQGPVAIALGLEPEGAPLPVGGGQAHPRPLAAFSRESA